MKKEFSYEKKSKQQQDDEDLIISLVPKISEILEGVRIDVAVNVILHSAISILPQIPSSVRQEFLTHIQNVVKKMGDKSFYDIPEFSKFIDDVDFSKKI